MKVIIEDMRVGEEIKISCNEDTSQEIKINSRMFGQTVRKAIRDNDEEA